MSIHVSFMPIDVPLFQSRVLEAVRGNASLDALRPEVLRVAGLRQAVLPLSLLLIGASYDHRDRLPDWYNNEVVENLPARVAELVDAYQHAENPEVARGLALSQLAILDPGGWNDPTRWNPEVAVVRLEESEEILAILDPYGYPAGADRTALDLDFGSDALRFNESLQPCWSVQALFTESILGVSKNLSECFETPDALFQPLFQDHPELEEALAEPYRNEAVGLFVRPGNVARARKEAEAVLPTPITEEGSETSDYEVNALRRLAEALHYVERRGLGFAERIS